MQNCEGIQNLVDISGHELVDSVEINKQEPIIHVHQGKDLELFSTRNFDVTGGHKHGG